MSNPNEDHILRSWHTNAGAWNTAIDSNAIRSRVLVTNEAIVNNIVELSPSTYLDLGCGEGWLVRAINEKLPGVVAEGADAIPNLVAMAGQKFKASHFTIASYQDIIAGQYKPARSYDVISFNFSLFGNELVGYLLTAIIPFFSPKGKLVIQTLHPYSSCGDLPYRDGWREGSWNGFSPDFNDPAPWYFRTFNGWFRLLHHCGYAITDIREPIHPETGMPASLIFVAQP
ncbi:class I SAM-dependent methyltransferase [Flavihumibacter rivuli]|uniref:class I SAM-dependent methyltransferase n=1 Tax=Flavihumibacter rivuli TaxID=2838156 RepID=UPI001BDEDED3|nr:methyltransferase domain-containing protein [Flavihumibacter rivuli]ULQ55725.1 class I SAM-dependent methyltransferase [Flavihumibacter rivuli]